MGMIRILVLFLRGVLRNRTELAAENLALRQQLAIFQQKSKTPRLRRRDRIFWAILSRIWTGWRSALLLVHPDTVVRWHRQGFTLFCRWKSRTGKGGRPTIKAGIPNPPPRLSPTTPVRRHPHFPTPASSVAWAFPDFAPAACEWRCQLLACTTPLL